MNNNLNMPKKNKYKNLSSNKETPKKKFMKNNKKNSYCSFMKENIEKYNNFLKKYSDMRRKK